MKPTPYRLATISIAVCLSVLPVASHAGLQDALDSMFMSNSTAPSAFDSQTRGGFIGGGYALRTPIRSINMVTFDQPRISAGCGGIDLFGGSFSFINAQQIVALFRQIAANAVGVAFKAAIDAINPSLGKLMDHFQNMIQAMNDTMKNTCQLANTIMDKTGISQAINQEVTEAVAGSVAPALGVAQDAFDSAAQWFSSPNALANNAQVRAANKEQGNLVWQALLSSQSANKFGNPQTGESDPNGTAEIIMSLIGAVIVGPTSDPDTTDANGVVQSNPSGPWDATMQLSNLRDGAQPGDREVDVLRCQDGYGATQCLKISPTRIYFDGTLGYTNRMLFGNPAGLSSGIDPNSIVGIMTNCQAGSCSFSTAQKLFIESVQTPVIALMRQVQRQPGAAISMAEMSAPIIADELMVHYAEAAYMAASTAFSGTNVTKPAAILAAVGRLWTELQSAWQKRDADVDRILKAKKMVEVIVENDPAVYARPTRRR